MSVNELKKLGYKIKRANIPKVLVDGDLFYIRKGDQRVIKTQQEITTMSHIEAVNLFAN